MQSPKLLLAVAIVCGLLFAYIDNRPTWDDTGILVGAIAITSAVLGWLGPQRPWLWSLAVGLPMPRPSAF